DARAPRPIPRAARRGAGGGGCCRARSGSGASDVLADAAVELRPAIAEEAPACAVLAGELEVERRYEHAGFVAAVFRQVVAPFVADEAVPVEVLAAFVADAVGGDDRHAVRHRVADHRPAPQAAGVHLRVLG